MLRIAKQPLGLRGDKSPSAAFSDVEKGAHSELSAFPRRQHGRTFGTERPTPNGAPIRVERVRQKGGPSGALPAEDSGRIDLMTPLSALPLTSRCAARDGAGQPDDGSEEDMKGKHTFLTQWAPFFPH